MTKKFSDRKASFKIQILDSLQKYETIEQRGLKTRTHFGYRPYLETPEEHGEPVYGKRRGKKDSRKMYPASVTKNI